MNKLHYQPENDGDLAPWEADLAQRLASLRELPVPPSFSAEATKRFIQQLPQQPIRTARSRRPATVARLGLRFAAIILACLLGLSGVGYATATSLPGGPLYGLKRQVESVQLAVSPADQQPGLAETLADRRLHEVTQLVEQGAPATRVEAGIEEYTAAVDAFGRAPAAPEKDLLFQRHLLVLNGLEKIAPKESRAALQAAQRATEAQLTPKQPVAPKPTLAVPAVQPTQTATMPAPSATAQPTHARQQSDAPPATHAPTATAEVVEPTAPPPTATTPVRPSPTTVQQAPARQAPARRASPQPTDAPPVQPSPQPTDAPSDQTRPDKDRKSVV